MDPSKPINASYFITKTQTDSDHLSFIILLIVTRVRWMTAINKLGVKFTGLVFQRGKKDR